MFLTFFFSLFVFIQVDGFGSSTLLSGPSASSQLSETSHLFGYSKNHQQSTRTQLATNTAGCQSEYKNAEMVLFYCYRKCYINSENVWHNLCHKPLLIQLMYLPPLPHPPPASSSLGCVWLCVFRFHSPVHPAQQLAAHPCCYPFCLPRTLHHPSAPQQREPDHLQWRGRGPWSREGCPMD